MAQTGYSPILIYSSSTANNTPSAGNLTNSTLGSELAINITDGKLFYKDNGGSVQVIGWKTVPTTAGGTGLTSYTAGDTLYYASGTALSKLAIGSSGYFMSSSGTAPQWSAPAALTKTDDTNVTLTLGGSASTALLNAASLTLGWTGLLSIARGGTNSNATPTAGGVGYGTGTAYAYSAAGTSGQALLSGAAGAPTWGTLGTGAGGTGLTSFTSNGILYASSSSALTTDSALTFDGTNFATTGQITGKRFNGAYVGAGNLRINASQTKTITVAVIGTPNALQIGFGGDLDNNGAFWGVNYQVNGSMVVGSTYSVNTTNSYTSSGTFTISAVTKNSNNFTFNVTNSDATWGGTIQFYFISSSAGSVTVS
jgi:hypothetical protein